MGGTFNSTTNNTTGGSIVPGQDNTVVYTIVVSNSGPSTAVGQTVTDSDLTSIPGWVSDSWTAAPPAAPASPRPAAAATSATR